MFYVDSPSARPSLLPSSSATVSPTQLPTLSPTIAPTRFPSAYTTSAPTRFGSVFPTTVPTYRPSLLPSAAPTFLPTVSPTQLPTLIPTIAPTRFPSANPTYAPISCPAGTYLSTAGALTCDSCPAGFYSSLAGSTSCNQCPAGKFSSSFALSSTFSAAPSSSMQIYYRFDVVSGTSVGDIASGSVVYDATLQNGAAVSNNQLKLSSAQSQHLSVNSFSTGTAGLSFSSWWKSIGSGIWARIFDFGNGPGSDNILLGNDPTNNNFLALHVWISAQMYILKTSFAFNQNAWNHVAVTFDPSGTWVLYINGVLSTSATSMPYPRSVSRSKNYLGRSNWAADAYFNGNIKDFRIYNRALSRSEVSTLFNATQTIFIGASKCTNCTTGQYSPAGSASCLVYPTAAPTCKLPALSLLYVDILFV